MKMLLLAILFIVAMTACGQKGPLRIDAPPPPVTAAPDAESDDAEAEPRRRDR